MVPECGSVCASSRRAVLLAVGLGLGARPLSPLRTRAEQLLQFDEQGRLLSDYSADTAFRTLTQGAASVQLLGAWRVEGAERRLSDPVTGPTASRLAFSATPTPKRTIADYGAVEQVVPTSLGLEDEMRRADMVAAARRTVAGIDYYEYDLALPARTCVAELATACLPERVTLLSACVADGNLHVLQVDANPEEWRRAGKALRNLRSTFAVRPNSDTP